MHPESALLSALPILTAPTPILTLDGLHIGLLRPLPLWPCTTPCSRLGLLVLHVSTVGQASPRVYKPAPTAYNTQSSMSLHVVKSCRCQCVPASGALWVRYWRCGGGEGVQGGIQGKRDRTRRDKEHHEMMDCHPASEAGRGLFSGSPTTDQGRTSWQREG